MGNRQKVFINSCKYEKFGGHTWARTKDPLIKSQLLYQLSYASTPTFPSARIIGLPPYSDCRNDRKGVSQLNPRGPSRHRLAAMMVPMQIMLVSIDDPPWLMKGRGMPTTGARPVTIIRLIAT
jgi:hypothetical protein